jgi:hypothetical protein
MHSTFGYRADFRLARRAFEKARDLCGSIALEIEKRGNSLWAQWSYTAPEDAASSDASHQSGSAHLILSWGDAGNWHARYWKTLRAQMRDGVCWVRLPDSNMPFYISGSVVDENGFVSSTPLKRVEPRLYRIEYSYTPLNYDGCSEWGNFEVAQVPYLKRHKWSPRLTRNAAIGRHAVILAEGETHLPMLHFTQGVPHRFTCWMKVPASEALAAKALATRTLAAAEPADAMNVDSNLEVVVQFNAGFNGKTQPDVHRVPVGTEWTPVELEVTPHEDLTQRHNVSVVVPDGVELLLDRVRFRPLPDPSADSDPLPPIANPRILVAQRSKAIRGVRVLDTSLNRARSVQHKPRAVNVVVEPPGATRQMPGYLLARRLP